MIKRTLCMLLMSALLLSFIPIRPVSAVPPALSDNWASYAASGFDSGSGSQSDPYVIASAEQLSYFANSISAGNDFIGKHIVLSCDIDLSAHTWTATSAPFAGTFNGRFYSVYGLNVASVPSGTDPNTSVCGLFGLVGQGGLVKNLQVNGKPYTNFR
jgi:hypothetical protein